MTDLRRDIVRLAVPAYLTLLAEPLFLLADTAIVGHLGTAQLAGLGIASTILLTAAGVFVFLAYGTTAVVARDLGAGRVRAALATGLDGIWLAAVLGTVAAGVLLLTAEPACLALGATASSGTLGHAATYLRISVLGLPAMLATYAATGILRGLQDTRTPLVVSLIGFPANIVLNLLLVYPAGLGLPGSALGTLLANTGMALALLAVVLRAARAHRAPLRPHPVRILRAARSGVPLVIRTIALRANLLLTTWAAAALGVVPLAAYQVSSTVWTFLVFSLDALAIAAQALTGRALGAGDVVGARRACAYVVRWGVGAGVVLGALVVALSPVAPGWFTSDAAVRAPLVVALVAVGLAQPLAAIAYVLDGVLIGAGDNRYVAWAGLVVLAGYAPVIVALQVYAGPLVGLDGGLSGGSGGSGGAGGAGALGEGLTLGPWHGAELAMLALWAAYSWSMLLRTLTLAFRVRGDAWLVTGAAR